MMLPAAVSAIDYGCQPGTSLLLATRGQYRLCMLLFAPDASGLSSTLLCLAELWIAFTATHAGCCCFLLIEASACCSSFDYHCMLLKYFACC